jgi:tRNA (guanine-N7-)-methyltransferase
LNHVRFAVKDAETFLAHYVGSSRIAEIHLYHPQPYHDRGRADRRVLTPHFLADVHRALVPGGLFVVQTDNPDYWAYMNRVLPAFFDFREHPGVWPDAPEGRTRREILARRRGLRIFRGEAIRRDDLSPESIAALEASLPLPAFRSRGPWCELDRWESRGHKE